MEQERRDKAWRNVRDALNELRMVLMEDNGWSEMINPEDEFLGQTIAEINTFIENHGLNELEG